MSIKKKLEKFDEKRLDIEQEVDRVLPFYLFIPIVATLAFFVGAPFPLIIFLSILTGIGVGAYHYSRIGAPFKDLSTEVRRQMIKNYMDTYHPGIEHKYYRGRRDVKDLITNTSLISPNEYHEEDVIEGQFKNAKFYFSEIDLKKKSNNSSISIFKGMLFHIKIPGRKFPRSRMQSKVGLLKKFLNGFVHNETYGFQYETDNIKDFNDSLGPLFPFIGHLIKEQGDLRIETRNNEILILLKSKVNFLDEPKQSVHESFDNKTYYENMVKQLNSFLYIVESFANELEEDEIGEGLDLRMLEAIKIVNKKNI